MMGIFGMVLGYEPPPGRGGPKWGPYLEDFVEMTHRPGGGGSMFMGIFGGISGDEPPPGRGGSMLMGISGGI